MQRHGPLLKIVTDFLRERNKRVVLNGQHSYWSEILAVVPQGSILGLLWFFIYIYDLTDDMKYNPKLFCRWHFLFSIVHDIDEAKNELNNDLVKIAKWAYQKKMSFNPDISKQAHESIFSRLRSINFNNIPFAQTVSQKHLRLQLDKKLDLDEHLSKVES